VAQRNDQIFQLSLTEIAFTIAFILLLLLGYQVGREQKDRKAAEDTLAKIQSIETATSGMEAAKDGLMSALKAANSSDPDEVITKLISTEEIRAERDFLKKQVVDLDTKLTALTRLQNSLNKAAQLSRPELTQQEVESAIALQDVVRTALDEEGNISSSSTIDSQPTSKQSRNEVLSQVKQSLVVSGELKKQLKAQLDKNLKLGQERENIEEVVAAAKGFQNLAKSAEGQVTIKKENTDLRGQVAFLKNKLEARGGRDYPPCWADEKTGKVEFLFSIEVQPDSVSVAPIWPSNREADAQALPGITEILSASPHSHINFVKNIQAIYNESQAGQCRHYVQLKSSINDAVQSDRARLMIESYFYKTEIRR
jgi:hypothetical protein